MESNSTTPQISTPTAPVWHLDRYGAISCLVGILIVVIFLIRPTYVPRRRKSTVEDHDCLSGASDWLKDRIPAWFVFPLDYSTVPVMVVLILWAMQVISIFDIWIALKGHEDSHLKPYSIIVLFFTLAYMSLSLDVTGLFDFIAAKAISFGGGSGLRLFLTFFGLSSAITVVTSNDIVILTLTPIICAMASYASLSNETTHALLFAQFFAANIWSMLLFIGNPTNIVAAQAFELDFVGYSRWMALPTIAAGFTCLIVIYFIFSSRGAIPLNIPIPILDPYANFVDIPGAIFGSVIFSICIIFIATSSATKIPIWIITIIGCVIMIGKDLFFDFRIRRRAQFLSPPNEDINSIQMDTVNDNDSSIIQLEGIEVYMPEEKKTEKTPKIPTPVLPIVISRLPWKVAPFVIGVFIIVETMSITGLTGWMAKAFSLIVGSSDSHASIFASIFIAAFTSAIACNIVNNQPMTIMYTNVLLSPMIHIGPKALRGALFSVVAGSNIGGNMTLVGALAGIMWKSILSDKGVQISATKFSIYGCITMLPVLLATSFTLYAEIVAS
jgi:arsenical pump membrane protein